MINNIGQSSIFENLTHVSGSKTTDNSEGKSLIPDRFNIVVLIIYKPH